jgi:hypothetical protein
VATTIIVAAATNPAIQFTVSLSGDGFEPPLVEAPPQEGAGRLARYVEELVT